jgi:hypothetical protein
MKNNLPKGVAPILKKMYSVENFSEGSVYPLAHTCGKKSCKCYRGEKHISYYLSFNRNGKTKMYYVPQKKLEEAKKWINNYSKLKTLIKELSDVNANSLKNSNNKKRKKN